MAPQHPKVLIAGAGLAGLALAQALRKQNMPFEIYERDTAPEAREQGWSIMLAWILPTLLPAMPDDMPEIERSISVTRDLASGMLPPGARIMDGRTGEVLFQFKQGGGPQGLGQLIRADRGQLRDWLATHIPVHWGKQAVGFDEDANGVTLRLKDGTTAHGDILVGADGVQSAIRKQLYGPDGPQLTTAPLNLIRFMFLLDGARTQKMLEWGPSFWGALWDNKRAMCGLKYINAAGDASEHHALLGIPDKTVSEPDHWATKASEKELYQFITDNIRDLNPEMLDILSQMDPAHCSAKAFPVRDILPQTLPRGRVTILGDAFHAMSPFRGEGGNHAMLSALNLFAALRDWDGQQALPDLLQECTKEVIARTYDAILAARKVTVSNEEFLKSSQSRMHEAKKRQVQQKAAGAGAQAEALKA